MTDSPSALEPLAAAPPMLLVWQPSQLRRCHEVRASDDATRAFLRLEYSATGGRAEVTATTGSWTVLHPQGHVRARTREVRDGEDRLLATIERTTHLLTGPGLDGGGYELTPTAHNWLGARSSAGSLFDVPYEGRSRPPWSEQRAAVRVHDLARTDPVAPLVLSLVVTQVLAQLEQGNDRFF